VLAALVVAVLAVLLVSRDLTSLMRNQRELRYLITPGNYLVALAKTASQGLRDGHAPREPIGLDAKLIHLAMADDRPRLLVLVVGETARAAEFFRARLCARDES
jgi:lipid A ethanolaminephosphotransferase